jgi:alpha-tubulin suppressor-like RCC1 family protein
MTYIDCRTPSQPAPPPPRSGRVPRFTRRLAPVLAPALLVAALGCREDAQSPTGPAPEPALDITPAQVLSFRQVSAGAQHTCGVTAAGRAYCWGINFSGELGNGTNTGPERCGVWPCSTRPLAVAGGLRFRHVSAGHGHTCGITTQERAYCWGRNGNGQLGDGTTADRLTPGAVAGGRRFRQVGVGGNHTCAITPFDVAFCWGANFAGQLGDGTFTDRPMPVRVARGLRWRQLSGGSGYSCGVTTEARAYCWGNNGNGQIGDGTRLNVRLRPVAVVGGLLFRRIDAGSAHTCGVTTGDRAYCWGFGGLGGLGDGTTRNARPTPHAVATTRRFDHLSAGGAHTCGVTLAGRGFCWGDNHKGQLGDGTTTNRLTPTALGVDLPLAQVSASIIPSHSCGVTTDGRAFCWGDNTYGQIGDGTAIQRLRPVPVAEPI